MCVRGIGRVNQLRLMWLAQPCSLRPSGAQPPAALHPLTHSCLIPKLHSLRYTGQDKMNTSCNIIKEILFKEKDVGLIIFGKGICMRKNVHKQMNPDYTNNVLQLRYM